MLNRIIEFLLCDDMFDDTTKIYDRNEGYRTRFAICGVSIQPRMTTVNDIILHMSMAESWQN